VVRLERNYRSTGHILDAAAQLIARNEGRLGKTLRTEDAAGEKVIIAGAWDSAEEARLICDDIELHQSRGESLAQMAVLVRVSAQMREIEERFVALGLPYRVIGGPRFYERAEIRDAMAYLRCIHAETDDLAFERIVNVPKRGLGDATLQQLYAFGRASGRSLMQAARLLIETEELKPKVRQTLRDLVQAFDRWRARLAHASHVEVAETMLEESGYTDMWRKDRSADAAGRLENLKELVRSLDEFPDLPGFLEHVSLVMDAAGADDGARVSLMTLHAAKGLEFDTVFLPGWEEGLFPNQRALDESGKAGLEEERRLAHVGITRARRRAKILFAANRRIHGLWQSAMPSRFIDELPERAVSIAEAASASSFGQGGYGASRFDRQPSFTSSYGTPGWQRAQARGGVGHDSAGFAGRLTDASARGGPKLIEGELIARSSGQASNFASGARVFHLKFGPGLVVSTDGNKLTVDFDKAGRKMVLDSFLQPG
jgi:DNA helicase-2/ATP-dependent DNA helicase PcrA